MIDFSFLPEKTKFNLACLSSAVDGVAPLKTKSWEIYTGSLAENGDEPALIEDVRRWAGPSGLYLYTISRESCEPSNDVVSRSFADAKASEKGKRAYARLNAPSSCIYVGGSEKIHQRIKEHLGYGAKGTYSLQLAAWAVPHNLHLKLCCAQYSAETSSEVLQALEDTLWAELKPMFGRQGAR